jgi:hypothetical protein
VPATENATVAVAPAARGLLNVVPSFEVAVCATVSWFVHVMLSPTLMVTVEGEKAKPWMVTV